MSSPLTSLILIRSRRIWASPQAQNYHVAAAARTTLRYRDESENRVRSWDQQKLTVGPSLTGGLGVHYQTFPPEHIPPSRQSGRLTLRLATIG